MKCPVCNNNLKQVKAVDVIVDACKGGCGGIWFDQSELKKFDEPHESDGGVLLDIERDYSIKVDHSAKRKCPKCHDIVMFKHFFCIKREVEVDECHNCAGYWLDYGELSLIRGQYNTEKERNKAISEYLDEIVAKEYQSIHKKNEENLRKARRIANIFCFPFGSKIGSV